jgi:hypothetical protein
MNKNKKFMTFLEGMVDDPKLRGTIKHAYRVCTEAESFDEIDTDKWSFEITDLEYSHEIAIKYFDIKNAIYEYKKTTGVDVIDNEDISVDATVEVKFEFDHEPYRPATRESSEEGAANIDGHDITRISLNLLIDGTDAGDIDIEDEEQLTELDPMLLAAINKEIEPHLDEIAEKAEQNASEYINERSIDRYEDEMDREPDDYDPF